LRAGQDGRARDGIHGWVAASRCRETLCWEPRDFEPNIETSFLSGEFDTNNNVLPPTDDDDSFVKSKLEPFQCFESTGEDCKDAQAPLAMEGAGLCFAKPATGWVMHVEITPPKGWVLEALVSQWREDRQEGPQPEEQPKYDYWRSRLWNKQMCVHGPFVADTGHGAKAEIHPAEAFWWNLSPGGDERKAFAADGPF